jgi:tetratricopeptide (TPR) repeat protein
MFHAAIATARSYQMKTRALLLMTAFLSTVLVFSPTADARLFTARLMGEDQQTLTPAHRLTQPIRLLRSTRTMSSVRNRPQDSLNLLIFTAGEGSTLMRKSLSKIWWQCAKECLAPTIQRLPVISPSWPTFIALKKTMRAPSRSFFNPWPSGKKSLGLHHRDVATSLKKLADLYQEQGRYQEAQPLYARALAILEEVLRPDDPEITAVRASYTALLEASARSLSRCGSPT